MYKFSITVLSLVIVTICAVATIAVGGEEVVLLFLEFVLRVLFPCVLLAVAGGVMVSQ